MCPPNNIKGSPRLSLVGPAPSLLTEDRVPLTGYSLYLNSDRGPSSVNGILALLARLARMISPRRNKKTLSLVLFILGNAAYRPARNISRPEGKVMLLYLF